MPYPCVFDGVWTILEIRFPDRKSLLEFFLVSWNAEIGLPLKSEKFAEGGAEAFSDKGILYSIEPEVPGSLATAGGVSFGFAVELLAELAFVFHPILDQNIYYNYRMVT